ncbi:MAG: hypothetical protein K0U47_00705 [Epsilonproteobacteria bacterium]|nr:hypothetical protein [Campylobacterota bacterium]
MLGKSLILLSACWLMVGCGGGSENNSENNLSEKQTKFLFTGENMTGEEIFTTEVNVEQGLGPHFNARTCDKCHDVPAVGGMGGDDDDLGFRIGYLADGVFSDLSGGHGGPTARTHSVTELGYDCDVREGIPAYANVVSVRSASSLIGLADIEKIPDDLIKAEAQDKGYGVHGKVNMVLTPDGTKAVGKFGWKAHKADLDEFTGEAFRNEMGLTNIFAKTDNFRSTDQKAKECVGYSTSLEMSEEAVIKVADFIRQLPSNTQKPDSLDSNGFTLFKQVKCDLCHKPSFTVEGQEIYLFSDLLLHDMGDGLNDNFVQGDAKGPDWRTIPLRDFRTRTHFLHDARTKEVEEAIRDHRGEGNISKTMFFRLSEEQRGEIIDFLNTL